MVERKAGVIGGVPVLRQDDMVEADHVAIDQWNDVIAACDRQCAARAEIILHIDNNQNFVFH